MVTQFVAALYQGETGRAETSDKDNGLPECPEGLTVAPDTDTVLAELRVPRAERERLKRPENMPELVRKILHRGPQGADVCLFPQTMPDPGFRTVQGKIAYGLDLDGSDGSTTPMYRCPHENFVGPNGERGIDNQLYRAIGCIKGRRRGGAMFLYSNNYMRQGDYTILIELEGVDDMKNDHEVRVGFYNGQDPMVNNVDGISLTYSSIRVHPDRHLHAVTRGKIVNGVLTTEPIDIRFKSSGQTAFYNFRDARFRGEFQPDGTLKGILGGYQDFAQIYYDIAKDREVVENDINGPITCPGLYYALRRLADAYPHEPGGQCRWISAAYEVDALPAFVIHPTEDSQRHASSR